MADVKTKPTARSAKEFLDTIEPKKKQDANVLLDMFERATGEKAVMWGTSIVGFGRYRVKSGNKENEWPLVAFSPRKQNFTLYLLSDTNKSEDPLFGKLGTYTTSKACLYINKLSDVDLGILETLIQKSFRHNKKMLA